MSAPNRRAHITARIVADAVATLGDGRLTTCALARRLGRAPLTVRRALLAGQSAIVVVERRADGPVWAVAR